MAKHTKNEREISLAEQFAQSLHEAIAIKKREAKAPQRRQVKLTQGISEEVLEVARDALEAVERHKNDDVDEWAERLAAEITDTPRRPHREICRLCHEVSRVGFWVPDDVWRAALHRSEVHDIICLQCFTRLADERGVEWDREIEFYPVSLITHGESK